MMRMQTRRHGAERLRQHAQLVVLLDHQRRKVKVAAFNIAAGGHQRIERTHDLAAAVANGGQRQRHNQHQAQQTAGRHQLHFPFAVALQPHDETVYFADVARHLLLIEACVAALQLLL